MTTTAKAAPSAEMTGIEHKSFDFEIKAIGECDHGTFEGMAGVKHNLDQVGDIVAVDAFKMDIPFFLAEGFIGGLGHDWKTPIGHPASAEETSEGLRIKAVFDDTPAAQAVRAMMKVNPETGRATVRKLSIGYKAEGKRLNQAEIKTYWQKVGHTPTDIELKRAASGGRLLTRVKVFEVSPVLIPANDLASIHGTKGAGAATFAERSETVASTVEESAASFKGYLSACLRRCDARLKEGREISKANWQDMKKVRDRHAAACDEHARTLEEFDDLLDRTEPGRKASPDAPAEKIASPSEPDVASASGPAIDHDAITREYAATIAMVSGALHPGIA